jgi:hypothetical protein
MTLQRRGDPGWLDALKGVRKSMASVLGAAYPATPSLDEIVDTLIQGSAWDEDLDRADIEGFVADYMRERAGEPVLNSAWASLLETTR